MPNPFLKKKLLPVVAGFVAAFAVMMAFEFTNSLLFPFPAGMDTNDLEAVRAFSRSLPATAFILVIGGWALGSFAAGWLTTRLSGESSYRLSLLVGILLTVLGIANNIMFVPQPWVNVIGLPLFLVGSYIGHAVARRK